MDYAYSLHLAPNRKQWFVRHLHALAIVVLPMLRPLRLLRLVTLISVLHRVAGNAERNAPGPSITTFSEALWWSVVTITTVGYGDLAPVAGLGRGMAVCLTIGGIALLGVVTATLAS